MSPEEVTQRIIKSRRTYSLMAQGVAEGVITGKWGERVQMLTAEIVILEQLAVENPAKANTLRALIDKYRAFREQLKRRMD